MVALQAGDRVLIKPIAGFRLIQEGICWWTNSQFSHIAPVLAENGSSIDVTVPKVKLCNVWEYLGNDRYRAVVIRPRSLFVPAEAAEWSASLLSQVGKRYDLMSFIGFLANKPLEDRNRVNCAEAIMQADHAAGRWPEHDGMYVSPQTYWDFTCAGAFDVIWRQNT